MTFEEAIDDFKKWSKSMATFSYVQLGLALPLLLYHLGYILLIPAVLLFVYHCRKLSIKANEFEENIDIKELFSAEEEIEDSVKLIKYISIESVILGLIISTAFAHIIHNGAYLYFYLILSIILYVLYIFLGRYLEPIINSMMVSLKAYKDLEAGEKYIYL